MRGLVNSNQTLGIKIRTLKKGGHEWWIKSSLTAVSFFSSLSARTYLTTSLEHFIVYALYCWNLIWCFMSLFLEIFYGIRLKSAEKLVYLQWMDFIFFCTASMLMLSKLKSWTRGKYIRKFRIQLKKSFYRWLINVWKKNNSLNILDEKHLWRLNVMLWKLSSNCPLEMGSIQDKSCPSYFIQHFFLHHKLQ